jgi:general stress protein 26
MNNKRQEAIDKLRDLIQNIETAMLTTIDGGVLRSRPMVTQQTEFDGDLWFFTSVQTHKVAEIMKDNRVNVSYASPDNDTYVSISGTAEFSTDEDKIAELWDPIQKAWFPDGLEDSNLILLKINVEQAEYWDSNSNAFVQIAGFLKAIATGERAEGGENEKITL